VTSSPLLSSSLPLQPPIKFSKNTTQSNKTRRKATGNNGANFALKLLKIDKQDAKPEGRRREKEDLYQDLGNYLHKKWQILIK
jgi:hypothetical protein